MKVLLISNGFPPQQWAGTETYTASLATELTRRGYAVQVLCGGNWQEGEHYWQGVTDENYQGVPVRRLNVNWTKAPDPFGYLFDNPVVADYLTDFLKETQPDLVHVTSCERLSASVIRVAKQANLPVVLSLTDFWFLCPRITLLRSDGENCDGQTSAWDCIHCLSQHAKIYRWPRKIMSEQGVAQLLTTLGHYPLLTRQPGLRGMIGDMEERKKIARQLFAAADYRITASTFVHNMFRQNGFDEPITVQPYGHDIAWLANYQGKTPSKRLRIGFIGQIIETKGVHLLLQAVSMLQEKYAGQIEILVYGNIKKSIEYGERLQRMAADIQNVQFCGTYAHEQSGDVFAGIDVLAVPSVWYDFPLIMHEAFASNTPVIATNLAGMAEAVQHNINGLLFERGNVEGLANQLRRLLEEPGLLRQLQRGIKPVKTVSEEVDEFEAIYHAVTTKELLAVVSNTPQRVLA